MNPSRRTLALVLGCCLAAQIPAAVRAQSISTVSPFLPVAGAAGPVVTTENSPIELHGIISSPSGYLFGLFDPVKRVGAWVKLNEAGHDFLVRSHDQQKDAVTVEYQGRVLTLALKSPQITSAAVPQVQPQVAGVSPRPPAVGAASMTDEQRLETVANEVRRRRAQRQAAAQQQQQQQGQPPAPKR